MRPDSKAIFATGGTPGVYLENGHVATITLPVIDVEKEQEHGNDGHGSKIIVLPFDGKAQKAANAVSAPPPKTEVSKSNVGARAPIPVK